MTSCFESNSKWPKAQEELGQEVLLQLFPLLCAHAKESILTKSTLCYGPGIINNWVHGSVACKHWVNIYLNATVIEIVNWMITSEFIVHKDASIARNSTIQLTFPCRRRQLFISNVWKQTLTCCWPMATSSFTYGAQVLLSLYSIWGITPNMESLHTAYAGV